MLLFFVFFFKQKTAYEMRISDWSSDVCSSDLRLLITSAGRRAGLVQCFRADAAALGIELEVIACDLEPELSAACHLADRRFAVPPVTSADYVDAVLAICRTFGVGLFVPQIEPEETEGATGGEGGVSKGS